MAKNRKYVKVEGTLTNVGTSEEVALQLPYLEGSPGGAIFLLRSFYFIRTGGTATFGPRLGEVAGFADDGVDERMGVPVAGNNLQDVYAAEVPVKTDSTGKLYFRPGFTSGSDNDADYAFFFETL